MAEAAPSAEKKPASPMKLVIVIIVGALLLVAVSIGGVFFMMKSMGMLGAGGAGGHAAADSHSKNEPAIYFPLEPAFVVNFKENNRSRFLQVTMEVMTRDPLIVEDIKTHMPLVRNNLLLLLGSQNAENFQSSEGKEKVRTAALEELKRLLAEETGKLKNVEGLYFTSFVTQ